ncbi:copper resistance D family protein [Nitrospira sp. Nam74]
MDDFLGGLSLMSYALVVGSLFWGVVVLRIANPDRCSSSVIRPAVTLLHWGAVALAVSVAMKLVIKGTVLASMLGELPLEAYLSTVQFKAGVLRLTLALALIWHAKRLTENPHKMLSWAIVAALTLPLVISGAWLVHAVGRFDDRGPLMFTTVVHQLAAAAWIGGVAQLLALRKSCHTDLGCKEFWPLAVTRFAWLGASCVVVLLLTGSFLAWTYIGTWNGLLGTGYGNLVLAKNGLLLMALGFAYLNNRAGRRWRTTGDLTSLAHKVPYYIEAETFLLATILFLAAALSSQPPAIDIKDRTASVWEVVNMFMPSLPRIHSPSHDELLAGEPGRVAVVNKTPSLAAKEWSDYNHNVSGIVLAAMGLIAMFSYARAHEYAWTRYWPIGFIGLGIFLFLRSDAETWPLGPIGFWDSTFRNGEVFQHRIATMLPFLLGSIELRARTHPETSNLPFLFPILCAFGGILLLSHAHAEFELKSEFLIQVVHTAMGMLAVIVAIGRWLELRLGSQIGSWEGRIAGLTSVTSLFLIGVIMMFYREPLM